MFNTSQRINSRDFAKIFKKGKKYFSPFFRIVVGGDTFGVAVVIPKKVIKKRVHRNREKRRILHLIKDILENTSFPHTGIIFWIQKNTHTLSPIELRAELQEIIKKTER